MNEKVEGTNEEKLHYFLLLNSKKDFSNLAGKCLFWQPQKPSHTWNLTIPFQNWEGDVHLLSQLLAIFLCLKTRYKAFVKVNTFSLLKKRTNILCSSLGWTPSVESSKNTQGGVLKKLRSVFEDEKNSNIRARDYHCWNAKQGALHLQLYFIYPISLYSATFNLKVSDWHCPTALDRLRSHISLPTEEGDIKFPMIIFTIHQKTAFPIYSFIQPLNRGSRECKHSIFMHRTTSF